MLLSLLVAVAAVACRVICVGCYQYICIYIDIHIYVYIYICVVCCSRWLVAVCDGVLLVIAAAVVDVIVC